MVELRADEKVDEKVDEMVGSSVERMVGWRARLMVALLEANWVGKKAAW